MLLPSIFVAGYRRLARAVFAVAFPFTVTLAVLTFALVVLGGIVHNTGSSLACPDWPLCNGTAFPRMTGAVLIEHGHRLTALAVVGGTILILLALGEHSQQQASRSPQARGSDSPRSARLAADRGAVKTAALALALVVVQALLGALTVKLRLPPAVSTAHLGTSMLFLATVIYLACRLRQNAAAAMSPQLRSLTLASAVLMYLQMVLGAAVRHVGAGLVCRELISCSGWLSGDVTLQLHMIHRVTAVAVLVLVTWTSIAVLGSGRARLLALAAPFLVLAQMALGLLTITSFRHIVPLTAHLAVAALLFGDLVTLHLVARGPLAHSHEESTSLLAAQVTT